MKKISVNIVTLGCSKNKVDSEHFAALLGDNFKVLHDAEIKTDIVVINTCGFIGDAQEESVDTILFYAQQRQKKKIKSLYVVGCLVQRFKKDLQDEIHEVDAFFGVNELDKLARTITNNADIQGFGTKRLLSTPTHYAYLKISEGCNRQCAFCAIPIIRGKHVSVPMQTLLKEAAELANKGVKELILIAQDLTYYGIDIDGKQHIVQLVEKLSEIDGIEWIRLHYGYPQGFPDELLEMMNNNPKICHYIDLPLQHINTRILKMMRRGVTHEQTQGFVDNVRRHVPDIAFRTTFIVGFPGETEADFEELCDFVRQMRFERVGVFAYSPEQGTPAFKMIDDVPDEIKQQRVDKLMSIQQDIALEINEKRVGNVEKALVDRMEDGFYVARSQYDSPEVDDEILIKTDKTLTIGDFVNVKITQADFFDCYAELEQ